MRIGIEHAMHDADFHRLLARFWLSPAGYHRVRKGVKKRLGRHFEEIGCRSMGDYLVRLDDSPALESRCRQLLGVAVSRFFRDPELWQHIEQTMLPEVVNNCDPASPLFVWSAGCACGEEAYSFKIVWERVRRHLRDAAELVLTATDINTRYLEKARIGIYPRSSLKQVRESIRSEFFGILPKGRRFKVNECLRAGIEWQIHDLVFDPPPGRQHIIFLRNNILTYCRPSLQQEIMERIRPYLIPGGYLVIGAKESLPPFNMGLQSDSRCPYVFVHSG